MDKYNIISVTDDINALTADMYDWYNLPFNLKMRANDDCMTIYGCYVPDLFNSIKNKILAAQDKANIEPSNIAIKENVYNKDDWFDINDISYKLQISKQLQESPYIIIIDPSDRDIKVLKAKHDSYISLNDRNRRISDDYSWQLWGYNVISMYNKNIAKITAPERDWSNLTVLTSENVDNNDNILREVTARQYLDFINNEFLSSNLDIMKEFVESKINDIPNSLKFLAKKITENELDTSIFGTTVPYMDINETINIDINIPDKNYKTALLEANNKFEKDNDPNHLLELGWNPNVPVNDKSIDYAKERQLDRMKITLYNTIHNVKEDDKETKFENMVPIYIVLGYKDEDSFFVDKFHYESWSISFYKSLTEMYTITKIADNNYNITKTDINNSYNSAYVNVFAFIVSVEIRDILKQKISCSVDSKISFNIITNILMKCKNIYSSEARTIMMNDIIAKLMFIANKDQNNYTVLCNNFYKFVFELESCYRYQYDEGIVKHRLLAGYSKLNSLNSVFNMISNEGDDNNEGA